MWRPGGFWRDFEYNGFGDPTGQHVRVSRPHPSGAGEIAGRKYFDGLGRVWEERASGPDAAGGGPGEPIVVSRELDARGNLQRETLPRYGEAAPVHARTFRYDGLDRIIRAENPDGTAKSFVHAIDTREATPADTTGDFSVPVLRVTATDEAGRATTTVSDAGGRVGQVNRHLGPSTGSGQAAVVETRRYDRAGRLTGVSDPEGNEWRYRYDLMGNRVYQSDPDLGVWRFTYDAAGNLKTRTDARDLVTTDQYAALNRLTRTLAPRPDGSPGSPPRRTRRAGPTRSSATTRSATASTPRFRSATRRAGSSTRRSASTRSARRTRSGR